MRTKTWIILLLSFLGFTARAAVIPIKITDFPRTNTIPAQALFLIAITNSVENTNYGFTYTNLFRQITSAIPVVINSFTNGSNFFTVGGYFTNIGGLVQLLGGSTNTVKFSTNNNGGMFMGDASIASNYFGYPSDGQSYLSVYDGSTGHLLNRWTHGVLQPSTTNGSYAVVTSQSGVNPSLTEAFVVLTNGVIASEFDINMQRTGAYLLLGGNVNEGFVGIQHGAQVSTPIGPNLIRAKWGGTDRWLLSTNGGVSFFGSATNYGVAYNKSNMIVSGTTLLQSTLAVNGPALFLNGLGSQGITNTIGFQTLGSIVLGDDPADLTVSSNTFRFFSPVYMQDAAITPNRVLYVDAGNLVATATFAPGDVSTIANMMNASNILSVLVGGMWTNDSGLNIVRLIAGSTNFIGGGVANTIGANTIYSTIGGGTQNTLSSNYSTIGGGFFNSSAGLYSVIGGGLLNSLSGDATTIGGGDGNSAAGNQATIAGGLNNDLGFQTSGGGTIGGGHFNDVSGDYGTTAGGFASTNSAIASFIGGGSRNAIYGTTDGLGYSTIGGGLGNRLGFPVSTSSHVSTIGGGERNSVLDRGEGSTIAGGRTNTITGALGTASTIGGGQGNVIGVTAQTATSYGTIGGGDRNSISFGATAPTIAGGSGNVIGSGVGLGNDPASYAFIGGGQRNTNEAANSVIAGGIANRIYGSTAAFFWYNSIGGGVQNLIGDTGRGVSYATVGGGKDNTIGGVANGGTVSGGQFNNIQQDSPFGTIVGGAGNVVGSNSAYSTILGGELNTIKTNTPYAFVIGRSVVASNANALEVAFTNTTGVVIDRANLHLVGGMRFKMTNGAANGALLTSDANGVATWSSGGGGGGGGGSGPAILSMSGLGTNTTFYGNIAVNTNVLVVTNGQVGIGTNTPTALLHVRPSTSSGSYFRIDDTNGTARLQMGTYPGSSDYGAIFMGNITTSSGDSATLSGNGNSSILNAPIGTVALRTGGNTRWTVASAGHLLAGTDNTYDIGASGATRPRDGFFGRNLVVSGTGNIRTNIGTMDVTTNLFVLGTRVTNGTRRIFVGASAQLSAAAAGTAKVTLYVENAGSVTNRLSISAGPLASLITVEPLFMAVSPGSIYYFTDETSGVGATASLLPETCSVTAF